MPFVSIRMLDEHSQESKDAIAQRVTDVISETAGLPREAVWVVFEDLPPTDWYVGAKTVRQIRAEAK